MDVAFFLTYYEFTVNADIPFKLCCTYVNGNRHEIHKLNDPIQITPKTDSPYKIYCVHLKNPVLIVPNKQCSLKIMLELRVNHTNKLKDVNNKKIAGVPFTITGNKNFFVTKMHFERETKDKNGFFTNFFNKLF